MGRPALGARVDRRTGQHPSSRSERIESPESPETGGRSARVCGTSSRTPGAGGVSLGIFAIGRVDASMARWEYRMGCLGGLVFEAAVEYLGWGWVGKESEQKYYCE